LLPRILTYPCRISGKSQLLFCEAQGCCRQGQVQQIDQISSTIGQTRCIRSSHSRLGQKKEKKKKRKKGKERPTTRRIGQKKKEKGKKGKKGKRTSVNLSDCLSKTSTVKKVPEIIAEAGVGNGYGKLKFWGNFKRK